jgi:hypothetical protein
LPLAGNELRYRVESRVITNEARDDVKMKVKHLLPAGGLIVLAKRYAIGGEGALSRAGYARSHAEDGPRELIRKFVKVADVTTWNNQGVAGVQWHRANQDE